MSVSITTTKVKVAFVGYKYHWESYSVVRSLWECLNDRSELEMVWFDKLYNYEQPVDIVLLVGALSEISFNGGVPTIRFGFSDPNLAIPHAGKINWYFTNDIKQSRMEGYQYFPCYSDMKYFKELNLEKETDILFVGAKKHPFINRESVINKLKNKGFNIKCFGDGWEEGFITGQRLVEEYNKAHLCLDITNKTIALSSRIFQSSMCGTPAITLKREDTLELFKPDMKEILLYRDYEELSGLLRAYLKNKRFLKQVGERAQLRCEKEHDITNRVDSLMRFLNDKGLLRSVSEKQ